MFCLQNLVTPTEHQNTILTFREFFKTFSDNGFLRNYANFLKILRNSREKVKDFSRILRNLREKTMIFAKLCGFFEDLDSSASSGFEVSESLRMNLAKKH